MSVKEAVKSKLKLLKDQGINILKLPYPLTLYPYGTFATPEELALGLLDLSDEEISALIHTLKACQESGIQYGEIDILIWEPPKGEVKTREKLASLYREFKAEVEKAFKSLPTYLQKRILSRGKPRLRAYIITESIIRVFLSYDKEEIPYTIYFNGDKEMLKIKASLLVSDIRDIATEEFLPF